MNLSDYVTVSEAAAAIGRSAVYVRSLLAKTDGKGPPFRGVKRGPRLWFVYLEDVKAFSPRPAGRPKKTATPPPTPRAPAKAAKPKTAQRRKRSAASKPPKASKRTR